MITARCPSPGCGERLNVVFNYPDLPRFQCAHCAQEPPGAASRPWLDGKQVIECPLCGGREMFIRKDFPQKLGLAIVVVAAIISTILIYRHTLAALAVLASVVVIDALIYLFVGRVTVCYRCRTELRGFAPNPAHEWFDLATAEKYPRRIESRQ